MRILNAHSLTAVGRVEPESFELNLSERDSSAVITLGPTAPELTIGQWLQDTEDPGAGIVWRVRAVDRQYETETVRVTLEHLGQSLADSIIPGEITAKTISGGSSCTAREAIQYILGLQTDWVLGDFAYDSVSNPYTFTGDTLKAAVETVSASLEDPVWRWDFSVYPFRLSIVRKDTEAVCEMRPGRNISTLRVSVDRSRMYTRIYPVGRNNLKLQPLPYVSRNEDLWGVIEHTETDQGKKTDAELRAWATDRLSRHCTPQVTVSVSGLDLSGATGEPLDRLQVGRVCRLPLPEYGITMLETVTRLSWRDKIRDKESVTVTLANNPEDVQSILSQQRSSGGHAARTSAEADEENALTIGWVESGLYTRIAQTASEIRREAHNETESLRTYVVQTAAEIRQEAQDDSNSIRSILTQQASQIAARVEKGGVATQLTVELGNVHVSGGDLVVDGYLQANGITTSEGGTLTADTLEARFGEIDTVSALTMSTGSVTGCDSFTMDSYSGDLVDSLSGGQIVQSGSGYELQYKTFSNDSWRGAGSFSRATTLTGAWGSGNSFPLTISASPQGNTFDIGFGSYNAHKIDLELVANGSVSASSIVQSIEVPLALRSLNSGQTAPTTRYTKTLTVSVSSLLESLTGTNKVTANGTYTPSSGKIGFSSVEVDVSGGAIPPSSHINVESGGHVSPSYSGGGTQISSWVGGIRTAVQNGYYFYFDAWLSDNSSDKKRYYIKF